MDISYRRSAITITETRRSHYHIALDPSKPCKENINITTHGHTDHLSKRDMSGRVICSDITKKMIKFYRPGSDIENTERYDDDNVSIRLYDAGHCLGSRMALVTDKVSGVRTLYTGDYNTTNKYCGKARPIRCDNLIIDSTYGHEKYAFPDYRDSIRDMVKNIKENTENNIRTRILSYSFGKPQESCHIMEKNRISFKTDERIKDINRHLDLKYKTSDDDASVMIARKRGEDRKEHVIAASGHAITSSYRFLTGADSTYVISDHADFFQGIRFIEGCRPEKVYTVFGKNKNFSKEIRHRLGIESVPLSRGQRVIDNFTT